MALKVGVDSYVTLEEAESLIADNHLSTSDLVVKWNTLSDSDKEVMLRTSCTDINNLKFDGRREVVGQKLEFPRVLTYPTGYGYRLFIGQFSDNGLVDGDYSSDGGLSFVKQAQVENAIYHSFLDDTVNKQVSINIKGITSKKAGPISESYDINNRYNKNALRGIYTDKVYSLLTPWLNDSRATV